MPQTVEGIHVPRPQPQVFDFLSRFENLPVWDAFVMESVQVGDGPVGVGTRGRGQSRFRGQHFEWTLEWAEFDPPRRLMFRQVEGGRDLRVAFTLEPVEGGTRVTQRNEVTTGLGLAGKLPGPVLEAIMRRSARANLRRLAAHLTTHP